jgi:eukaryotic-like serine/threonine-protein kinase
VHPAADCLSDDDLLALAGGRSLAEAPAAEAHLARCAACSSLLATAVRDAGPRWDDLAGTTLGPYRIDAQIGAGGMGAVYRAWDPRLHRAIAVKVLHASGSRLAAEARAAAAIAHPNVVAIHDVGVAGGVTYVAMELVEGESLRSVIARGPLPVERARAIALELAEGLAAAHARGVVHRDLKPENLILAQGVAQSGRLRILDFGLAVLADAAPLDTTDPGGPGAAVGTAGYMAPEQARGEAVDARADLFAAGAILYELVTGARAFAGGSHAERLTAALRDTPSADALQALGALAPIVERCLAKEPRDRFQTASDLAWALGRAGAPPLPQAAALSGPAPAPVVSRRALVAVAGGVGALAAIGGFVVGRRGRSAGGAVARRPVFEQLTYRTGRIFTARFSADGTRLLYGAAWDGEPVHVVELELAGGGLRAIELGSADLLAVSPRGELAVGLGRRFTEHQSSTGRLAIVPAAGGEPRMLADSVEDADFTPSGAPVAVRRAGGRSRIELPLGTVLVESAGWIAHARVSPDGAHVAYVEHPHTNDDAGDLCLADVASRTTRVLAGGWSSIAGVAWERSGARVWFAASTVGAFNELRAVDLAGRVAPVAQTTGRLRLHDLAGDGRAAVTVDVWRLRTMAVEPAAAGIAQRDVSLSWVSYAADLSADGTTIALGEADEHVGEIATYLAPVSGGKTLRLGPGFPLGIAPSGTWVAAILRGDDPGPGRIVAYATTSAAQRAFPAPPGVLSARWIDEDRLVASAGGRLWRLAADTPPLALTPPGEAGLVAVDPSRRRAAHVDRAGVLRVTDVESGATTVVPGTFTDLVACGWLAAPDAILVRTRTTPMTLTRVDPTSGATTRHLELAPPATGLKAVDTLVIHADGVRYAYSYGQELSHLYVMTLAP